MTLPRRLAAEAIGTGMLVAIVVGSGIMAERLSDGNVALALLANSVATGAGLVALISAFGTVSAQFNPVVTLAAAATRSLPWGEAPWYVGAQFVGGVAGVVTAHGMFGMTLLAASGHERSGWAQLLAEFVATFGLLLVIAGCGRGRPKSLAVAAGSYIASAYWFTSSTAFANPAVTIARALTDTFTGIRPADVPGFLLAQVAGACAAIVVSKRLFPELSA